jgi:hypothetical protein
MNFRTALIYDVLSLLFGAAVLITGLVFSTYILVLLGGLVVLGVIFIRRREIAAVFTRRGNG